jgi:hypothetical protein
MIKNLNHVIKRTASLLSDLFISVNVYSFFHALGPYKYFEKLIGYPWVILILNFIAFRVFFNLIIGLSLSQYIFGFRADGGIIWKRVGGALRSIYEIPLLVFFPFTEMPILWGKRSLKEFFSQTKIKPKNSKFNFFKIFIFLPFTFFLAIFSPLFEGAFTPNPVISPKVISLIQKELRPETNYQISGVGLKTSSGLLKNRFVIIPSFKITKSGNENEYHPQYIVYDKILKRNLTFYFEEGPNIINYVKSGQFLNPMFAFNFPELNFLSDTPPNELLKRESEELGILLENSLTFRPSNPFEYILNNGIFIKGALNLRAEILDKFPGSKIEKIRLGDKTFLVFKELKNKRVSETFFPLFLKKTFLLKINHTSDLDFRNDFLSAFFYFSNWQSPDNDKSYFLAKNNSNSENFATETLLESAAEALALSDPLYLETVLEGLDSYIFVFQLKRGITMDTQSLNKLKNQKSAILEKTFALKGL